MNHTNRKEITAALEAWKIQNRKTALLEHLLLVRNARRQASAENNPHAYRRLTNAVLLDAISHIGDENEHYPKLLEKRFLDGLSNGDVAAELGFSQPYFFKLRRNALQALTDRINSQEEGLRHEHVEKLRQSFPALRPNQLFGARDSHTKILTELRDPTGSRQISLTGIGGIGKTSLAIAILQELAADFRYDHYIWVEIESPPLHNPTNCIAQVLAVIKQYLNTQEYGLLNKAQMQRWFQTNRAVLIVDNVEVEQDANDLLAAFSDWLGTSRMVMTSRAVSAQEQHQLEQPLDELSEQSAFALIRHLALNANKHALASADDDTLHAIFERTGGNPLAIELVLGLLKKLPLTAVLADLPKANLAEVNAMYFRIYNHVWRNLSEDGRKLFKMMPLIGPRGATPEHMQKVTKLETQPFWSALSELTGHSLLIQRGDEINPRYAIHRISEQYLETEIIFNANRS